MGYFWPEVSGSPILCEFRLVVLARRPGFGEMRVPGRFVVLDEDTFVYYVFGYVFWVVSDLDLTLETLSFVCYMRGVFVGGFV